MRKALTALPGVKHVYIDFKKKTALVSIEKSHTDDDARLTAALDDAGFGGTIAETESKSKNEKTPEKTGK